MYKVLKLKSFKQLRYLLTTFKHNSKNNIYGIQLNTIRTERHNYMMFFETVVHMFA